MGEGLLTAEIKQSLEKIITHCFYSNRILDRMCSILSVTFVMPNTANTIHHKLAHLYPLLADEISNYMDSRNCTTIYGETIKGDQTYDSYVECFREMLEIQLDLESLTKDSILLAQSSNDYTTKVYLEKFLLELISITQSIMTLVDKSEMYGDSRDDSMRFDHDLSSFGVFGE